MVPGVRENIATTTSTLTTTNNEQESEIETCQKQIEDLKKQLGKGSKNQYRATKSLFIL